ncbi:MAG TPA: hypothetical protein EYQ64_14440 [Gemmatimonadetes bacterium]|nr:hypothetical protein [Gemmatimonadota bacterium]
MEDHLEIVSLRRRLVTNSLRLTGGSISPFQRIVTPPRATLIAACISISPSCRR